MLATKYKKPYLIIQILASLVIIVGGIIAAKYAFELIDYVKNDENSYGDGLLDSIRKCVSWFSVMTTGVAIVRGGAVLSFCDALFFLFKSKKISNSAKEKTYGISISITNFILSFGIITFTSILNVVLKTLDTLSSNDGTIEDLKSGAIGAAVTIIIMMILAVVLIVVSIRALLKSHCKQRNSYNRIPTCCENEKSTDSDSTIDADISNNEVFDINQQPSTLITSWTCAKCNNVNSLFDIYCQGCGEKKQVFIASNTLNGADNCTESEDITAIHTPPKSKGFNKSQIVAIFALLGGIALIGLIVFLVINFANPPYKDKTLSSDMMNVAQKYVDSNEFVYGYNKDYQSRFTITSFEGRIADYYQFNIIGKQINKSTGKVTTITAEDNIAIVLTENEKGITFVPASKWIYKYSPTNSEYSEKYYSAYVVKMTYNYKTGKPYVVVGLYNNTNSDAVFPKISVDITDNNGRIAYEKFEIDQKVRANSYKDLNLEFSGVTFKFREDVSNISWEIKSV